MDEKYSSILKSVQKPGRYSGGEYGQTIKDLSDGRVKARFAFCFPDTYEIGMSNLGVRILYGALNREEDIWCERAYAPWADMEEKMIEHDMPLCALESGDPLSMFDIVGFTLQYEMCYTNVLQMLKLAKIPLKSADRTNDQPIIIGGGPCSYNPEPLADFFDCFSIGEGEDMLVEFTKLLIEEKAKAIVTRARIIIEIQELDNADFIRLLNLRYIARDKYGKQLEWREVAKRMGYEESTIYWKHGLALLAFKDKHCSILEL